jgi:hypothetical protein
MALKAVKIKVSQFGTKEVRELYARMPARVIAATNRVLESVCTDVLVEAKRTLRSNRTNASGDLQISSRVYSIENGYRVGFYSGHAAVVETGRRAGTPPPYRPIKDWVHKRGFVKASLPKSNPSRRTLRRRRKAQTLDQRETSAAIAIAKSIGKYGTRPQPYFYPAVVKCSRTIPNRMVQALTDAINETMK